MPKLTIANAQFNYRFDGPSHAPVLVLSNSLGTHLDMWAPQMPDFARHFRVLRYDTRGHGESSVTEGPYSVEQLGGDVLGLVDAFGIGRFDFCGLSMGGMIGMWLGVHAPQRVRKLLLANTAAKIGSAELWNARIDTVRAGGMAAVADVVAERWFTQGFRARDPAAVARIRQMLLDAPPEGYCANCAAIRDMDQREVIARIACPTLVLTGAHDGLTPAADGRFVAATVPGARYVELDASHLSNVEQPQEFSRAVIDFLAA